MLESEYISSALSETIRIIGLLSSMQQIGMIEIGPSLTPIPNPLGRRVHFHYH